MGDLMANWIPFHDDLRRRKYRGVPRALRFVLLELALEAKPGRGDIELPLGMTDIDGVHDILGGSREEIEAALAIFCAGDDPALVFDGPVGARRLHIPGWARRAGFNASGEVVGASTKRSRAHRYKRDDVAEAPADGAESEENGQDSGETASASDATEMQRIGSVAATVVQRSCNGEGLPLLQRSATVVQRSYIDIDSTRQNRTDPPVVPLAGDGPGPAGSNASPAKPASSKRQGTASEPTGYSAVVACYFAAFEAARGTKPAFSAADGKTAKRLIARAGSAEMACAAIRGAFSDPFWARTRGGLGDIASDPNRHIGKAAQRGGALAARPGQHAPPPPESAEVEAALERARLERITRERRESPLPAEEF